MRPRKASRTNPTADEVVVGRIAGAFGLRGELKCDPTPAGRTVFSVGASLRAKRDGASSAVCLTSVRPHKGRLLLRLEGIDDLTAAQSFAGATLYAPRAAIALREEEYLAADLIGCEAYGLDGRSYGQVERVEKYPGSDMLVVSGRLVPMVGAIVKAIDLAQRRIVLDPPHGLLEDETPG